MWEASFEGYETIVEMVDHGSEGATEHRIALRRSAQPFTVVTEPADARVRFLSIEERYRPGMELPAGEYRVEASLEGYETMVEIVRHGSAGATEHQIALRRSAQPFTVLTEPAGARVRFLSIEERYRPGIQLPAGEYRVEASLEGYDTIVEGRSSRAGTCDGAPNRTAAGGAAVDAGRAVPGLSGLPADGGDSGGVVPHGLPERRRRLLRR